jgi:hypothetical protein
MKDVNRWTGTWCTRNGTIVEIASKAFNDGIVIGKIIDNNIVSMWNATTGNHVENTDLDLVIKKRDEDPTSFWK